MGLFSNNQKKKQSESHPYYLEDGIPRLGGSRGLMVVPLVDPFERPPFRILGFMGLPPSLGAHHPKEAAGASVPSKPHGKP